MTTKDIEEYLEEVKDRVAHYLLYIFCCGPPTTTMIETVEFDINELVKYDADPFKE